MSRRWHRAALLPGVVASFIAACAQPENSFDEARDRTEPAGSGRGGSSSAGRSGSAGTTSVAGSTSVGGSASSTGGKGGAAAAGAPSNEEGGSAGAADGAGSAGEGAAQGEGGGGSTPTSGECASALTARVQYKLLRSDSVIQFQLRFSNEGAVPLALGQYEFDYYFSNEEDSQWNAYVDDASTNGGTDGYVALIGVTEVEPMPLSPPSAGATHVVRITIDSTTPLEPGDEGLMSIRLEPTSYEMPHQVQADDYSFDASKTELSDWDHVTVSVGGELAWGCVP